MTHPLSEELRQAANEELLERKIRLLRRAADALDLSEVDIAVYKDERDELRLQCDYAIKNQEIERGIVDELRRQLEDAETTIAFGLSLHAQTTALASRYRDVLEHVEGICPRDWLPWITKALRDPETGGET